jgi:hypothetical protein
MSVRQTKSRFPSSEADWLKDSSPARKGLKQKRLTSAFPKRAVTLAAKDNLKDFSDAAI